MDLDASLRSQLIDAARAHAIGRGWTWLEPVEVTASSHRGEPAWVIRTNATMRGQNIRVVVRRSDNTIVEAGYLPR
jgi:hypothetical protein